MDRNINIKFKETVILVEELEKLEDVQISYL